MSENSKKLDFDPNQLSNKALDFLNQENFLEAKKILEKLIIHFPNNCDLLNLLGFSALQLGLFAESVKAYSSSLKKNKKQVGALFNMAIANEKLGSKKKALKNYDDALNLDPNNLDIYQNKSAIFEDLGEFDKALDEINFVIKNSFNNDKALANRGNIYQNKFEYNLAKDDYLAALKINSQNVDILINLGNVQKQLKEYKAAEVSFLQAIKYSADNSAHFNLSLLYLFLQDFSKGWIEYEYRKTRYDIPNSIKNLDLLDEFNNEKKIIIWAEQGIGDQIIFSSMLNDLPKNNQITVALDKRLIPIYKISFDFLKFIDLEKLKNISKYDFDCHLPIGSLGKFYRLKIDSFINQPNGFLKPNNLEVKKIKMQLSKKDKKICGISWKSKNEKIGFAKSLKLSEMLDLFMLEDLCFVDLQYGDTEQEKKELFKKNIVDFHTPERLDKFKDISGLLNYIEACDFIVTSSNVTAHLAGSIGKKTYLMVPHGIGKIWYWHDDNFSLWYPSIKIFRQTKPNEWKSIVKKIANEIKLNF